MPLQSLTSFLDCHVLILISVLYHYNILILKTSSIDTAYLLHCDWLHEQARWNHLARSGIPVVFPQGEDKQKQTQELVHKSFNANSELSIFPDL